MRLTLERFGGLAGVPAKPLVVDTAGLPEQRAKSLERLAESVLDERPRQEPQPDAFGYELTIETEQGRRVIAFDHGSASDALAQLIKELRA
jgi:hypothetical protein